MFKKVSNDALKSNKVTKSNKDKDFDEVIGGKLDPDIQESAS